MSFRRRGLRKENERGVSGLEVECLWTDSRLASADMEDMALCKYTVAYPPIFSQAFLRRLLSLESNGVLCA